MRRKDESVPGSGGSASQLLPQTVADLDPVERGILDLSLRRRLADEELAELLGIEPEEVAERREAVLATVAEQLGGDLEAHRKELERALSKLPDDTWLGAAPAAAPDPELDPDPDPDAEPDQGADPISDPAPVPVPVPVPVLVPDRTAAPDPDADSAAEPAAPKRRRLTLALLAALLLGAVGLVAALSSSEDAPEQPTVASAPDPVAPPEPTPEPRPLVMKPVAGAPPARVSLRLAEAGPPPVLGLTVRAESRRSGFQVWLYDTVIDSRPLARIPPRGGSVRFALPARASEYRYLDVSLERAGGFTGHSGRSVARIELADVLPGEVGG